MSLSFYLRKKKKGERVVRSGNGKESSGNRFRYSMKYVFEDHLGYTFLYTVILLSEMPQDWIQLI